MFRKPGCLLLPAGGGGFELAPELSGMVRDAQVAEFVDDDVTQYCFRHDHQPPVERQVSAGRARSPSRPLVADGDRGELEPQPGCLRLARLDDGVLGATAIPTR